MTQGTATQSEDTEAHDADLPLVRVRGLRKSFKRPRGSVGERVIRAADGLDLDVLRGEALGLVGESGSGKSTVGRLVLRLLEADAGTVEFDGVNLMTCSSGELRRRRRHMQMVFQDPLASLNPRLTIRATIREPMDLHSIQKESERPGAVRDLMERVGLDWDLARSTPEKLSGGQRQRVGIARALATNPKLIVADEPISNLDVSIQAQVLNLFSSLKKERGLTLLFIAHDLATVRHLCDRVAVMKKGQIVELGRTDDLFERPTHAYTRELLAAIPRPPFPSPGSKIEHV